YAVFYDRLDSQGARNFAVRFAAHAVRQHKQAHRGYNAEAILIVRADAAHIGRTATRDSHTGSLGVTEPTPPTQFRNPYSQLAKGQRNGKAMLPMNYRCFRHRPACTKLLLRPVALRNSWSLDLSQPCRGIDDTLPLASHRVPRFALAQRLFLLFI